MITMEVDQRDIQKQGGIYSRYPASGVIYILLGEILDRIGGEKN